MSVVMLNYSKDKDTKFEVVKSYSGNVTLHVDSIYGVDCSLTMQPDQLRMLVSAVAEYLHGKEVKANEQN